MPIPWGATGDLSWSQRHTVRCYDGRKVRLWKRCMLPLVLKASHSIFLMDIELAIFLRVRYLSLRRSFWKVKDVPPHSFCWTPPLIPNFAFSLFNFLTSLSYHKFLFHYLSSWNVSRYFPDILSLFFKFFQLLVFLSVLFFSYFLLFLSFTFPVVFVAH